MRISFETRMPENFQSHSGPLPPGLIKALVLAQVLGFLLMACPSPAKKSRDELARRGIEFSEKAFFQQIREGRPETVKLFLAAGMPPDIQDQGYTPLLEAARRGDRETALELIEGGANINAKDPYGVTALMFSLIAGSTDVALRLIEKGAEVNSRDVDGRTALVEALSSENEIPPEIVEALVRGGADVNIRLAGGLTPLMIAVSGDPGVVRLLVEAGADINAKDESGAGVRERAGENPEYIRILEEAQASRPAAKKEDRP
jgi:ankyrin repeat protein